MSQVSDFVYLILIFIKNVNKAPGGCTIAGLLALEDGKVRSTMARTIQVATTHASGLGQSKKWIINYYYKDT